MQRIMDKNQLSSGTPEKLLGRLEKGFKIKKEVMDLLNEEFTLVLKG